MVIEGGISNQILAQPYEKYSKWVSHCWLKSVWEKVHFFNLTAKKNVLPLPFPFKNDDWLMLVFERNGFPIKELIIMNRVQCHQHIFFYSGIFGTRGKSLDRRYHNKRPHGEKWSNLIFLNEKHTGKDFHLWNKVLDSIAPRGIPKHRLGEWIARGHKIWLQDDDYHDIAAESPTLFWQVLLKWER